MLKYIVAFALSFLLFVCVSQAQTANDLINTGNTKYANNDFLAAIDDYTEAIRKDPNSAIAYRNRGIARKQLGKNEEAIYDLSDAIRLNPQYYDAYVDRALAKNNLKKYEEAIEDCAKAISLNPGSSSVYTARAYARRNLKKYQEAIEDYNESLRIDSKSAYVWNELGFTKTILKKYEEAIGDFTHAIVIDPRNRYAYTSRAESKQSLKRYDEAIQDYTEAIRVDPKATWVYGSRARCYFAFDKYEAAIEDYTSFIGFEPKKILGYTGRAEAYRSLKKYEESIQDYSEAIRIDPKSTTAYSGRALSASYSGNYDAALADYTELIRLDPQYYRYANRADLLMSLQRNEEALADISEALRIEPKYGFCYTLRGKINLAEQKYLEAFNNFSESIRLNPSTTSAYLYRGRALLGLGKKEEAKRDFEEALLGLDSLIPKYPKNKFSYFQRGIGREGLGQDKEALADYSLAITEFPNNIEIQKNYSNLKEKMNIKSVVAPVALTTRTAASESTKPPPLLNPVGKYYGLIIGISQYSDPSMNLDRPLLDAKKFREVLLANYSFDPQDVKILNNPTRGQIIGELFRLRQNLKPDDNLIIFYAGHGFWDKDIKQGYWWPRDATRMDPSNWLSNSDIKEQIRGINSGHTLLISDACFSGGIFKSRGMEALKSASLDIKLLYKMPSRRAMTSGSLSTVPDESVFFQYLIKRLQENKEKFLSSQALFDSFKTAVINNSMIVPQDGVINEAGDEGGDFIFIRK